MKKSFIYILLLLILPMGLLAQPRTVGTTGADYPTLKAAFDDINAGILTGAITLEIIDNTSETVSAVLDASGGSSDYTSVSIYPTVTGIIISGGIGGPLIDLNGADNVTIDGRVNATGDVKDMIIDNSSSAATAGTSTIRFINEATNNRIQYCVLKGSETATTSGILFFSTSTGTTGNNGNLIDKNDITSSADDNRPVNAIYSSGTTAKANSGNTISNNNIYDNLNRGIASNGIFLTINNTQWTLSGNSFYETAPFDPSASVTYYVIRINNAGVNYSVSDNFIGGSAPSCGGSEWTKTNAFNNIFYGIYIIAATSTASSLQNNTIRNINWSNSANGAWTGINIAGGNVNVGSITGNTIGATTGTGSILVTCTTNSNVYGINISSPGIVNCLNNKIGSITITNDDANGCNFFGINKTFSGGSTTISNNTIGSASTPGSILASSPSTGNAQAVRGIYNAGTGIITISGNTIANLTNGTTNATVSTVGKINGIFSSSGTNTISDNIIRNLTIANANGQADLNASVSGIALSGPTLKNVTGNIISNLSNTNATFAGYISGLFFTGSTGGNAISENFIDSLSVTSSSATIYGIQINSGASRYSNNIITLGGDTETTIYGIYEAGATGNDNELFFNTIYIGGNPATGASNSYALYSEGTANTLDIRNNIISNARSSASGSHYALYIANTDGTLISDYNNYYVSGTGGIPGYYLADITTLPIVTDQDVSSKSSDPGFANAGGHSPTDYVPSSSSIIAVTETGVTTDYEGTARSESTPSMGAFEIVFPKNIDVYRSSLLLESYQYLKEAFDAINDGTHKTGSFEIRIKGSIYEENSAVLNASGTGDADYTSVKIFPTAPGISITGNMSAPLIDLNGANNVTIDGRVNASGGIKDMIIMNSNSSDIASTIRLIEGASVNIVRYCTLKGSATGSASGIVLFSTSTGITGNNGNTIDNNNITSSSEDSRPVNAIYSSGSPGKENSGDTLRNNNIFNNLNKGISSSGIYLATNNTAWTISGNSFYETAPFTPTVSVPYYGIRINNTGINYSVSHNFLGGSSPMCGGSAWTKASFNNIFYGIHFGAGTGTVSNIQNNTIKNIDWSNSSSGAWTGLHIGAGTVNIGTLTGNTIGGATGVDSILIRSAVSGNNVYGINIASTGTVTCLNNNIGAITMANAAAIGSNFYGINKTATAGITTISRNTIGSTLTANSISASSASTNYAQTVRGIYNAGTGTITISGNTIANLTNNTTNTNLSTIGRINGIFSSSGTNTISDNIIHHLKISNANNQAGLNASVSGILLSGPTLKDVTGNTIYNLSNTYATYTGYVSGLFFTGSTGGNTISRNFIHSLSVVSSSATIYGIQINSGSSSYSNNIISLGGNTATTLYGIYETGASGTSNIFCFNTVYIGGIPSTGALPSYAFFNNSNANTRNFRNNIFVNGRSNSGATGKHYAIRLQGITNLTIDYNDYYAPGSGGVLGYLTSDRTTLAAWQTATGQDADSKDLDPEFGSPGGTLAVNYVPYASLIGVDGTCSTVDFGLITRSSPPTMGAWEGIFNVWRGTISDDWADPINWTGGTVPGTDASIGFDPAPLNDLRMDMDRSVDNIINTTSTQIITDGHKLTIKGSLVFSGGALIDASENSSIVEYAGLVTQSILPGSFLNDEVYDLTLNNANNVVLSGTLNLLNTLTVPSGILDAYTATPTLIYGGTTPQTLSGSTFLDGRLYNLTIDNVAGVALNTDIIVDNELTINPAGIFAINPPGTATINSIINNGTINLNSTSASDIFSMIINNYSGTGISNVQLFLTGGGTPNYNWHYIAVPADGISKTYFTDINDINLLAYDDSRVTTSDYNGWLYHDGHSIPGIAPSSGFSTLTFGRGYNFFTWTDATVNLNGMPSLGTTLGSVPLQYSGSSPNNPIYGLNLLGNSLTCSLDWDKVIFNGAVGQAVYYTSGNQWITYLQGVGGTNGATKDLPPLQGFIVKATGIGASIDLSNAREHSTQPRYKKSGSSEEPSKEVATYPKIKLELTGPETSDELLVWCSDDASTSYDDKYDAIKLFSSDTKFSQVYSILNGVNYTINGLPSPVKTTIIPLGLKIGQTGNYSIRKKDFTAPAGYDILLIDKANNNFTVNLKNSGEYSFAIDKGTFPDRFILKFLSLSSVTEDPKTMNKDFNIYGFNGMINIIPLTSQVSDTKGEVNVFDLTGRIIKNIKNIVWHEGTPIQIPYNEHRGIYMVEATSGSLRIVEKILLK